MKIIAASSSILLTRYYIYNLYEDSLSQISENKSLVALRKKFIFYFRNKRVIKIELMQQLLRGRIACRNNTVSTHTSREGVKQGLVIDH